MAPLLGIAVLIVLGAHAAGLESGYIFGMLALIALLPLVQAATAHRGAPLNRAASPVDQAFAGITLATMALAIVPLTALYPEEIFGLQEVEAFGWGAIAAGSTIVLFLTFELILAALRFLADEAEQPKTLSGFLAELGEMLIDMSKALTALEAKADSASSAKPPRRT